VSQGIPPAFKHFIRHRISASHIFAQRLAGSGGGCYIAATFEPPSRWPYYLSKAKFVKIFCGTSNIPLAKSITASIGMELGKCTVSAFPDGETFVKIEENIRGEDVFIVQSTSPPTNHYLMEMFIMMDAVRRASASRITAVLPFYGYARRTARTSRACRSRPSWWPISWSPPGQPHFDHGPARAANPGLLRHPGGSSLRGAGDV